MAIQEVLLIGGAAGAGKSSAGWEVSVQLNRLAIAHWHLEGDVLDADLDRHLSSTRRTADYLERMAPGWIVRLPTDDRTVSEIAREPIELSGWTC